MNQQLKIINNIAAYIAAFFAVLIRSCFEDFAVITENNASVDDGLTIINKGIKTAKNVDAGSVAIKVLSQIYFINLW